MLRFYVTFERTVSKCINCTTRNMNDSDHSLHLRVDVALKRLQDKEETCQFTFEDISALNLDEQVLNLVIEYLHSESQVAALNWIRRVSETCASSTFVEEHRRKIQHEFQQALWVADGSMDQREMYKTTASYLSSAVRNCVCPVPESRSLHTTDVANACIHAMKTSSQMALTTLSTCMHRIETLQRLADCKCVEHVQCVMIVPSSHNDVKKFVAGLYMRGRYVFEVGADKADFSMLASVFSGDSEIHQTHGLDCLPVRLREDVKIKIVWKWIVSQTQSLKSFLDLERSKIERLHTTSNFAYNFATMKNQDLIDVLCFRRITVPRLDTSRPESIENQMMICSDWYLQSIPFANTFVLAFLVHHGCGKGMIKNTWTKNVFLCALTRAAAITMSDEWDHGTSNSSDQISSNIVRESQEEPEEKILDSIDMQNQFVNQLSNKISSVAQGRSPDQIVSPHDLSCPDSYLL